jgi:hypothetical protein
VLFSRGRREEQTKKPKVPENIDEFLELQSARINIVVATRRNKNEALDVVREGRDFDRDLVERRYNIIVGEGRRAGDRRKDRKLGQKAAEDRSYVPGSVLPAQMKVPKVPGNPASKENVVKADAVNTGSTVSATAAIRDLRFIVRLLGVCSFTRLANALTPP